MKNTHIVFLDLDGPLFSKRALLLSENNEFSDEYLAELELDPRVTYWYADPVAIMMLIELYRIHSFKLVMTSLWADDDFHNKEQIERLLKKNLLGIPLHIQWRTPRNNSDCKATQIKEWLDNNKCDDYLIIDDLESGKDFQNIETLNKLEIDKEKVVLVSPEDGILMRDFYKMQAIVLNWD